jgi:hypothetical protein
VLRTTVPNGLSLSFSHSLPLSGCNTEGALPAGKEQCGGAPGVGTACVEDLVEKQNKTTLFKVTEPSSVPYRTPPACVTVLAVVEAVGAAGVLSACRTEVPHVQHGPLCMWHRRATLHVTQEGYSGRVTVTLPVFFPAYMCSMASGTCSRP